jgi:hypothetical protein
MQLAELSRSRFDPAQQSGRASNILPGNRILMLEAGTGG